MGYVNTISEPTGSGMSTRGSRSTVSSLDFIEATERSLTDGGHDDARSVLLYFSAAAAVALPCFLCQQQETSRTVALLCGTD